MDCAVTGFFTSRLGIDDQIDVLEFCREFFQRDALPFLAVVLEEHVRRVGSPPFVVGQA